MNLALDLDLDLDFDLDFEVDPDLVHQYPVSGKGIELQSIY